MPDLYNILAIITPRKEGNPPRNIHDYQEITMTYLYPSGNVFHIGKH
jgi:hypothetical protein